jgi:KDO2-lipid IV(A) lauroyltransferase
LPGDDRKTPLSQDLIWRLQAVGFAGLIGFLRMLGVDRASAFGGWLLRHLGPRTGTHRTVQRNLRIAFPDMDPTEREQLAVDQWEQTGRTFAETAVMDQLTPASGRVEVIGMERLHAIRDSGRPVVFVSGHIANFEVMAAVIMAAGDLSSGQQPLCRRPDPPEPRAVRHPAVRAEGGRWRARTAGRPGPGRVSGPAK